MNNEYYIFIFIGIVFILRTLEFTKQPHTFGSLIIAGIIVYILYNYNSNQEEEENQKFRKNVLGEKNFEQNKYRFIKNEPEILELFYQIKNLKRYNSQTIEEALAYFNNFYRLIRDLNIGVQYASQNIQIAQEQRLKGLNMLKSLSINIPINHDRLIEDNLIKIIQRIDEITYTKIKQINDDNFKDWKKDADITKNIVYLDGPQPRDPDLNKNLEIY